MRLNAADREYLRKRVKNLIPQMKKSEIVKHFEKEGIARRTRLGQWEKIINFKFLVIQNVSIRQETNFYDENICLGIELTKQVEFFQNVISTEFPGSSKSKVFFRPIFG